MENSLYIHIPFCKRKCPYCDFYSMVYDKELSSAYIDVITGQIAKLDGRFSTVYIGGGTPSALEPKVLKRLLNALGPRLSGAGTEFTVEANPESLDGERIKVLLDSGVNRISIGVQSLDDKKLKKIMRLHNAEKARKSVLLAAKMGFSNISIDLIFGVWGEDPKGWEDEVKEAASLPVKHISCYSLTYEEGTPLFKILHSGEIQPVEDDRVSVMYETAISLLADRGFKQYEISNFARGEDYRCRHNVNYWENNPYTGLGASAVSYMDGVRARNIPDAGEYIRRCKDGASLIESSEKLSPARRAGETAAVKIRTSDGINFEWFREKTGYNFLELEAKAIAELLEKDLIKYKREGRALTGIALKQKGFLFCDMVSAALLSAD